MEKKNKDLKIAHDSDYCFIYIVQILKLLAMDSLEFTFNLTYIPNPLLIIHIKELAWKPINHTETAVVTITSVNTDINIILYLRKLLFV